MRKYTAIMIACIASSSLFSNAYMTFTCVNGNDLATFSYSTTTRNATFSYQNSQGEGFSLAEEQLIVQKNCNMLQVIGIVSNHARYFGLRAFFPSPVAGNGIMTARIKSTDVVGLPINAETYECSVEITSL